MVDYLECMQNIYYLYDSSLIAPLVLFIHSKTFHHAKDNKTLQIAIAAAEKIQEKLYSKYDYVKLIEFPRFEDFGIYIWEVK